MDEQLTALLEGINALKSGQEETKERMEKVQLEKCRKKCQEGLKKSLEEKINSVKDSIAGKEQVEERVEGVAENFSLMLLLFLMPPV
ncbi:hypothetical protein TNCV_3479041 [Trichonephila clavipes]|nr:hypothetical protein TNCV_3479041 [Trichonephila clavipes]